MFTKYVKPRDYADLIVPFEENKVSIDTIEGKSNELKIFLKKLMIILCKE